jgi:hypothetical protein
MSTTSTKPNTKSKQAGTLPTRRGSSTKFDFNFSVQGEWPTFEPATGLKPGTETAAASRLTEIQRFRDQGDNVETAVSRACEEEDVLS